MSDEDVVPSHDPRVESIARELSQLSAGDQELVMALVSRLRENPDADTEYPPDVPFMDFDE